MFVDGQQVLQQVSATSRLGGDTVGIQKQQPDDPLQH